MPFTLKFPLWFKNLLGVIIIKWLNKLKYKLTDDSETLDTKVANWNNNCNVSNKRIYDIVHSLNKVNIFISIRSKALDSKTKLPPPPIKKPIDEK